MTNRGTLAQNFLLALVVGKTPHPDHHASRLCHRPERWSQSPGGEVGRECSKVHNAFADARYPARPRRSPAVPVVGHDNLVPNQQELS
jgi:hypothetical protein